MATLAPMPPVSIAQAELAQFGTAWEQNGGRLSRTPPRSSGELGRLFDVAVGQALATMLGGIPLVTPNPTALIPAQSDCVEVGPVRVVGGVRPQNFDVGYRPDGIRFAFDSKTLNDQESIGKNWQNMINDLATEATTVHSRFPHAVVAFMVVFPLPCVSAAHQRATIETLERLARRPAVDGPLYMAEAISLVVWNPADGSIDVNIPPARSPLRIEQFSSQVEAVYVSRYKGLPPHTD
ncbi:MAG TPA: hypothetical protein VKQ36_14035 [Ktedonobacterales bacterium]|nr:hypothetical protein [Ktedonobacterales bacterium]